MRFLSTPSSIILFFSLIHFPLAFFHCYIFQKLLYFLTYHSFSSKKTYFHFTILSTFLLLFFKSYSNPKFFHLSYLFLLSFLISFIFLLDFNYSSFYFPPVSSDLIYSFIPSKNLLLFLFYFCPP